MFLNFLSNICSLIFLEFKTRKSYLSLFKFITLTVLFQNDKGTNYDLKNFPYKKLSIAKEIKTSAFPLDQIIIIHYNVLLVKCLNLAVTHKLFMQKE